MTHWRRNQTAVTIATFIGFTGFTIVMPFLPLYFEQLGVHDPSEIAIWSGLSLGITPAITAVMAPVWARVADRFGRKLMVARSLASFVLIMSLLGVRPGAVAGLPAARDPGAVCGLRADCDGDGRRVGAARAGRDGDRLGPDARSGSDPRSARSSAARSRGALGLRNTFLVSATFYLFALLLIVVGFREPPERRAAEPAGANAATSLRTLRRVPHFLLFMATVFCLQLVDRSFGPILPLYLREAGAGMAVIPFLAGVIFTTTAGAAAVGNQIAGWLLRRWQPSLLVPAASALAGIGTFVFGAGAPTGVLIVTAAVMGLGLGVATTAVYTAATHAVAPSARTVAFGYLSTAYLAGLAVSPMLAGLVGSISVRAVFLVDAIGLGLLAWIVQKRMSEPR